MEVECYLNGIFPRSELALESGSKLLKGRETKENFYDILENETRQIIELQQNLELDYITDAQLFWHDFLRPIANALGLHRENSNTDEGSVTRQVYTNTFYRKPLILRRLENFDKKIIDTKFIDIIPKGKRKVMLPSPFAIAYLSDGIHRNEEGKIKEDIFVELLFDFARIFNNEAKRLENNHHVSFVQFNDPCMAYAEETHSLWNPILESLSIATKGLKAITSLHLYNGDISKFLPDLLEIPVERMGIDPYATNMRKFFGTTVKKFLEIGVINSKNSLIEEPDTIKRYAEQIKEKINPSGLALVPNRPLELVPQEIAIQKIKNLAKAVDSLRASGDEK